ncbi:hypothetical protein FOL46_005209 [Perkinsus olseni]|uniref:26S protease regulatory subunit 10B n=1 Tax=Perkinsus olseni TaxID=32597 RepID=A0A7J6LU11_PEROL|nr:hypothetical protein FOL46_005209 [Perkinsus olseni]
MAPPSPVIQHAKLSLTSPLSKTAAAATDQPVARMCGKKCDRTTWLAADKPTVTAKPTTAPKPSTEPPDLLPYFNGLPHASNPREQAINAYIGKVKEHREYEARCKKLREQIKEVENDFETSEDHLKALQSVGQIVGEVLKQLDEERFIVKASSGPRYVVTCKQRLDAAKLTTGTRVALDITTLTIMKAMPREVDPLVFSMLSEDPGEVLDPALLRPGRLDRKIEIPLPNETARVDILKIHASKLAKHGDIDYDALAKLSDGFNGADLRNICTEAGMFAIRAERDYVIEEDFMKAVRKLAESKKLEGKLDYEKV